MNDNYLYDLFIDDLKKLSQNGGSMSGGVSKTVDTKIFSDVVRSSFASDVGVYVNQPDIYGLKSIPTTITVWLDGVQYTDLPVINIPNMGDCFGNLGLMGTSFENTGEPFLAAFASMTSVLFMFVTDTSGTDHSLCLSVPEESISESAKKYLPDIPVIDLIELGLPMLTNDSPSRELSISDDTFNILVDAVKSGPVSVRFAANCASRVNVNGASNMAGGNIITGACGSSSLCVDYDNGEAVDFISLIIPVAEHTFKFVVHEWNKTLYARFIEGDTL